MFQVKESDLTIQNKYKELLAFYLQNQNEAGLYQAQQYSKVLLDNKTSPEDLVSLHYSVLEEVFPDIPEQVKNSFEFLLEVMIGYGLAYREHQILRNRQRELELQIDVAANMQQTLLPKEIPVLDTLDIGIISIPASKMSGDYYYCVKDDNGCIGLAIADIIGKGVPAALCMSMIKYAIDSLPEQRMQPGALLENLNRVVANNVDESMFITMMYGSYDSRNHEFYYSGAGHEPGFYYHYDSDEFEELYAKGLVLGVSRKATFREYKRVVNKGDFMVLLSDGVTETKVDDRFLEREEITTIIRQFINLPAQEMVENIYRELAQIQGFTLKDDFTIMILRRKV
ncbi:PP2C family protein-serine/threonine phosphatase [Bacillus alkalicellulosilyticus]|uniref:PP2C family protein-serine/threonine phosphatase n=1 Tax=Alkalihalobacterium alkalicellulosilyticum TaxID=1912214 RepID=UPI0009966487|nr:PP2C family protein-serine/threonine phosphatase [Bacillus alkalicellulosilyticus]